jgi:NAD(P)-dependent dehydrogenase (short-subunit alcohol dehydrogenase family)
MTFGNGINIKLNLEATVRFSSKLMIVAGGTGGLGRAVSLAFLEEGARVAVTYRNPAEFQALMTAAGSNASSLLGEAVDVTDEPAVRKFVDGIVATSSHIDALVNTVGGYAGGIKFWELDPKTFDNMLNLNVRSGYILAHVIVPAMLKQKRGAIVNVSARAALDHAAGATAYAASKAAALAMMDSLAEDLRGTGVRVNTILPSIIDTEPNREAMPNADFAKWPKPDEIARVILFLCSDDARVIHGAAIPVYGER